MLTTTVWKRDEEDGHEDYGNWERWVGSQLPDYCDTDWSDLDHVLKANLYAVFGCLVRDLEEERKELDANFEKLSERVVELEGELQVMTQDDDGLEEMANHSPIDGFFVQSPHEGNLAVTEYDHCYVIDSLDVTLPKDDQQLDEVVAVCEHIIDSATALNGEGEVSIRAKVPKGIGFGFDVGKVVEEIGEKVQPIIKGLISDEQYQYDKVFLAETMGRISQAIYPTIEPLAKRPIWEALKIEIPKGGYKIGVDVAQGSDRPNVGDVDELMEHLRVGMKKPGLMDSGTYIQPRDDVVRYFLKNVRPTIAKLARVSVKHATMMKGYNELEQRHNGLCREKQVLELELNETKLSCNDLQKERDEVAAQNKQLLETLNWHPSLTYEKWKASGVGVGNGIIGFWAEDHTEYHVTTPHQLRDHLIEAQNKAVDIRRESEVG